MTEPTPSVVYDTYWKFAFERQEIFFKRFRGLPAPWTADPILQANKFTNAYRASDRVSQYLIRNVIYGAGRPNTPEEIFYRIILFKIFNKIETWELLETSLGPMAWDRYSFDRLDAVLCAARARKQAIYSGAYVMPSGSTSYGSIQKHRNHLSLIEHMMDNGLSEKLASMKSMKSAFQEILSYPTMGNFLAYQYVTDLNYSTLTNFREDEFVIPGPGALDGIKKCFQSTGSLTPSEVIQWVAERQEVEFKRLGLEFKTLFGRHLQWIDCQNLFCEVDKYSRVKHPEISGISGRTKIKQRFTENKTPISLFYPPKWNLTVGS